MSFKTTTTLNKTVEKINLNIEKDTSLAKNLSFYETVRQARDLSATTFELKLIYLNGLTAFTKLYLWRVTK